MIASRANAETGVTRTITMVWAAATLAFLATSIGPIVAVGPFIDPIYEVIAVSVVFGMPIAIGIAARWLSRRTIRVLYGSYAVAYLVLVVFWIVALEGRVLPPTLSPWIVELTALATVPATLAWRPAIAWTYLAINAALIFPVRFVSAGMVDLATPLQYAFFTVTYTAIFSVVADAAVRNAAALDAATSSARETAARAAAAEARRREQARLDALVHDAVMGTLYYASRGDAALDRAVRRQAATALATLEELRAQTDETSGAVSPDVFIARVRSVALVSAPGIRVSVVARRGQPVPGEVAAAFAEATAEAVRNSVLHAGPGEIERRVDIELDDHRIRVVIADRGRGFDPRDVGPHRLGIPVSIRGRLEAITGGAAEVDSRVGRGTRVRLEWSAR